MRSSTVGRFHSTSLRGWKRTLLCVIALAWAALWPARASATEGGPPLEEAPCPAEMTGEAPDSVWCGFLTVPEDRDDPDSATIRVFVTRALPSGEPYPDPVMSFDELGWGLDLRAESQVGAMPLGTSLRRHREIIGIDPRGTGRSEPSLACPEVEELAPLRFATRSGDPGTRAALVDAVTECRGRLVDAGIDVAAYDLEAIAADAEDLRMALGIERWNLRSSGSGSRVLFEILRRYPEHVRAAWLESPELPTHDLLGTGIVGTRHALEEVISACAENPACDEQFPDLGALMAEQIKRWDEDPIEWHGHHRGVDIPYLEDTAFHLLTRREAATWFSELIPVGYYSLEREGPPSEEGGGEPADWITGGPAFYFGYGAQPWELEYFSDGAWFSTVCRDQMPFVDDEALVVQAGDEPGYRKAFVDAPIVHICRAWDVGAADSSVHEAVASDVPSLIFHGRFDPYAPRPLAEEAASMFSTGWSVEYPTDGYDVVGNPCALDVRNVWLDDPMSAPDTTCIDRLPPMEFPTTLG
jgi:pimeloyl-ACP methyl ester carboxylesterase